MTNTLLSITLFNVSFIRNGAFSAFLVFLVTAVETEEKKMRAGLNYQKCYGDVSTLIDEISLSMEVVPPWLKFKDFGTKL